MSGRAGSIVSTGDRRAGRRLVAVLVTSMAISALSVGSAWALAPEAPVTEAAEVLTGTTATLKGELNPGASSENVAYRFAYSAGAGAGCSESGHTVPAEPFPEASGNHKKASASATGLEGDTEYSVCLVAANPANAEEVTAGNQVSFTTPAARPVIAAERPEGVVGTPFSALLEAEINPENLVTTYRFEYAEEEATIGTAGATSIGEAAFARGSEVDGTGPVEVAGLNANSTYYYRVVASNSTGTTAGPTGSFTTAALGLPAIEEESAAPTGQSTASLSATINPEFQETSCLGFEYGLTEAYGSQLACEPEAFGAVPYGEHAGASLTGLAANTSYHYRVRAKNATGEAVGADATFVTLPNPPVVTTGGVSALAARSASVAGTVNPANAGQPAQDETLYYFQYGHTTDYDAQIPVVPGSAGEGEAPITLTATLGGLEPGSTYHYRIVASNDNATTPQVVYGEDRTFTTVSTPPILSRVTVAYVSETTAAISAALDPRGLPVRYELQVGSVAGQLRPAVSGNTASAVQLTLSPTALTPGTIYYYSLIATGPDGTSEANGSFLTTTAPPAAAMPSLPAFVPSIPIADLDAKEAEENGTVHAVILTNKQKLAKALAACRKGKQNHKRAVCERQVRRRYPINR